MKKIIYHKKGSKEIMKKRMKKLSALCLAGMLCLGLWACSSSEDDLKAVERQIQQKLHLPQKKRITQMRMWITVQKNRKLVKMDFR